MEREAQGGPERTPQGQAQPVAAAAAPREAGWYPDPWGRGQHRYWDGGDWTAHTFPSGPTSSPAARDGSAEGEEPTRRLDVEPPPPEWASPRQRVAFAVPTPPHPAPVTAGAAGLHWRVPQGRALLALVIAVGLIIGFSSAGIFYALTGESKPSSPTAAQLIPQAPLPTTPPTTTPSTTPGTTPTPNPGGTPGTTPGAGTGPGGAAAAPTDPFSSVLSGLVVNQSDVPPNVTVEPLPGGTEVSGQPTLDLCNGTFPSESLRTARLQVAAVDQQGQGTLSTEAVLYGNPAATAQAFSELRSVAAHCPSGPVASPVGEPTVSTRFNPAPDGPWPVVAGVDRLAYDFVTTDESGQTQHSVAVYLRRGRVLMGVYFPHPDGPQPAVQGQTTMAGIVNVFATRIAQLPASAVNGG